MVARCYFLRYFLARDVGRSRPPQLERSVSPRENRIEIEIAPHHRPQRKWQFSRHTHKADVSSMRNRSTLLPNWRCAQRAEARGSVYIRQTQADESVVSSSGKGGGATPKLVLQCVQVMRQIRVKYAMICYVKRQVLCLEITINNKTQKKKES